MLFTWDDGRIQSLKDAWGEMPTSAIAVELGCTRSAVIGKAYRLGLARLKQGAASPSYYRAGPEKQFRFARKSIKPIAEKPMVIEPLNIGFMELEEHHCREVVGQGEDGLATYCGHPKHGNSSYCSSHSAVNELLSVPKKVNGYFRIRAVA